MLPSELGLALTPVPAVAAALLVYGLPSQWRGAVRTVALLGLAATVALLCIEAVAVTGGARTQVALGDQLVAGLILRADPTGIVIALTAAVAGLLTAAEVRLEHLRLCGLLVCVVGSVVAALAGDAVTLFAGVEAANAGSLLLLTGGMGRRTGRGILAVVVVEHLGALALLASAIQLESTQGTAAFAGLLPGAITFAIGWPWALGAVLRLVTPALLPASRLSGEAAAWAATAAVPTAAAMILRLRGAVGATGFPLAIEVGLAVVGGAIALASAWWVLRARGNRLRTGGGLLALTAAPLVALIGFPADAGVAVAAGIAWLELTAASLPLWAGVRWSGGRWLTAVTVLAAGGLPVGFGTTALVLELGTVATLGRGGVALLVALLLGVAAGAVAASRYAATALTAPVEGSRNAVLAVAALLVSTVAALLPGAAVALVVSLLSGGPVRAAGPGAVLAPGGGWGGGYVLIAAAFVAVTAIAGARIAGVELAPAAPAARPQAPPRRTPRLVAWRVVHATGRRVLAGADVADAWLVLQPQMPLLIGGALVALLLIH